MAERLTDERIQEIIDGKTVSYPSYKLMARELKERRASEGWISDEKEFEIGDIYLAEMDYFECIGVIHDREFVFGRLLNKENPTEFKHDFSLVKSKWVKTKYSPQQ